jgi:hypothetical protein
MQRFISLSNTQRALRPIAACESVVTVNGTKAGWVIAVFESLALALASSLLFAFVTRQYPRALDWLNFLTDNPRSSKALTTCRVWFVSHLGTFTKSDNGCYSYISEPMVSSRTQSYVATKFYATTCPVGWIPLFYDARLLSFLAPKLLNYRLELFYSLFEFGDRCISRVNFHDPTLPSNSTVEQISSLTLNSYAYHEPRIAAIS